MEFQEIRDLIEQHIRTGLRHADYETNCRIADEARAFVTGEGFYASMVREFRDKENKEQRDLRVQLSDPKTPEAISPILSVLKRVYRVDGISDDYGEGYSPELQAQLEGVLSQFGGNLTVEQYLEQQQLHFESVDPNAFILIERRDTRNAEGVISATQTYPVEVTSHQAINYGVTQNKVDWLLVLRPDIEIVDDKPEEVEKYYFYMAGKAVTFFEYKDIANVEVTGNTDLITITDKADKKRNFAVRDYETGSKEFPGMKWGGYRYAASDDLSVKAPVYYGAYHLLRSIVKKASLKDVSLYKHVYPRMYYYDAPCEAVHDGLECNGGKLGNSNKVCPTCNGTGSKFHKSELEAVRILIPEIDEDVRKSMVPISDFVHYARVPLEETKFIKEDLADDMKAFFLSVFNSQQEQMIFAARTATEVAFNADNLNNTCKPFADQYSRLLELVVRVTAQYMEVEDGLNYNHSFGKTLGVESEEMMIASANAVKAAGFSQELVDSYEARLLSKRYPEQKDKAANWSALQQHKPFASLPAGEATLVLQGRAPEDFDRILYENWDSISRSATRINPRFFALSYERQEGIIKKLVDEKKESIVFVSAGSDLGIDFESIAA